MTKRSLAQSRYSKDAIRLLATLIRRARDTSCGIGSVFEAATIVGVSLFDMDHSTIRSHLSQQEKFLSLLPKSIRKKVVTMNDDF
jgi:hypothetical protein